MLLEGTDLIEALMNAGAAALWTRYLQEWTFWNHVWAVAPIVSAALFIAALV